MSLDPYATFLFFMKNILAFIWENGQSRHRLTFKLVYKYSCKMHESTACHFQKSEIKLRDWLFPWSPKTVPWCIVNLAITMSLAQNSEWPI